MLSVYQLPVPTPYPVGPVNVFLIKNEPVTLIDAGPDTPKAKKILQNTLKSMGVELFQVKRIILTHSHPDHCGLAAWLSDAGGAEIFAHPWEIRRMKMKSDHVKERLPFLLQSGLPGKQFEEIMKAEDKLPRPNLDHKDIRFLYGGEILDYDGGGLKVLHLPGHAPGHLCLFAPASCYFFSGDFLLPHITPNPILEPDPENPSRRLPVLQQYFAGIKIIAQMDIKLVWPGHGGVFSDTKGVIKMGYDHHHRQFAKIKEVLGRERKNCYQVTQAIYPSLSGWNIFMGISEILAHLDYLCGVGELGNELVNGVMYFWNTGR